MSQKVKGVAIGIDLGTTYSCAAVWLNNKNRVEVIPNEQGNKITPSYVAFTDSEILVGEAAKNQIARNPTNTVFDVKRLIGSRFGDPQVTNDMQSWPFKVIKGPSEKPTVVVKYKGEDKQYSPEELSAMVLKKMKEAAEEYIGRKVTDAVITVPAYFNNQQREATKEAGSLAGLNVLRLLNEPTAAAIAYGVDNFADKQWDKDKNVLVFDLGGGTFDVSLLTISKTGDINVKAVGGDTHLGGEDFDTALVNYCIREFMNKHREANLRGNPRAVARLKVACEKAKRDLSSTTFSPIEIDCLCEGNDFLIKISRAKFEELNSTYFTKCVKLVEKCLFDGAMKKKDVDEVVVVGGSSRIPKVQQMVEKYFEGKTLYKTTNADEAVAFGAAILASKLSGNGCSVVSDFVLQDVTPLSLGIQVTKNGVRGTMAIVVPRNTSIPTSKKKIFTIPVTACRLSISVYQGEGVKTRDNNLLGKFKLDVLSPVANRRSGLEVCFNLDLNGILLVSAEEISTGLKNSITIARS